MVRGKHKMSKFKKQTIPDNFILNIQFPKTQKKLLKPISVGPPKSLGE